MTRMIFVFCVGKRIWKTFHLTGLFWQISARFFTGAMVVDVLREEIWLGVFLWIWME